MVDIRPDKKSDSVWIITKTDAEGFHQQLSLNKQDMDILMQAWITINKAK